jgi:hypothetical protein
MRVTSSLLFAAIIVFGALALTANAAYPLFKERKAKGETRPWRQANSLPEINRNTELLATIEKDFQAGSLGRQIWSRGLGDNLEGLLLGFDSDVITKLLRVYSLEYRTNELSAAIIDASTGIASALSTHEATRLRLVGGFAATLKELHSAVTELGALWVSGHHRGAP